MVKDFLKLRKYNIHEVNKQIIQSQSNLNSVRQEDEKANDPSIGKTTDSSQDTSEKDENHTGDKVVHDTVVQDKVVHNTVVQDKVVHDTVVQDTVVQDTVVHDTVVQDTVVHDTVVQDTVVQDTVVHDTVVQDPVVHDIGTANPNITRKESQE